MKTEKQIAAGIPLLQQITEGVFFNVCTKDKQANHIVLLAK